MFTDATNYQIDDDVDVNLEELFEQFFFDEHYADSDEEKMELFQNAAVLEKANITNRKTLVRLNKNDDIRRRSTMAALQIAKQKKDPLWNKLVLNRVKERQLLKAINKRYGNKAVMVAKRGQREYLKNVNKSKMLKASDLDNRH